MSISSICRPAQRNLVITGSTQDQIFNADYRSSSLYIEIIHRGQQIRQYQVKANCLIASAAHALGFDQVARRRNGIMGFQLFSWIC